MNSSNNSEVESTLFPEAPQLKDSGQQSALLEEYKLFVDTSEKLVARRQTVNTFFLSINALLMSAIGVVVNEAIKTPLVALGILPIGGAGILLCVAWRTLVRSFRQLNAGKFAIIHLLEQYLPAALFKAEWKVLGGGKDKNKYTPFTKTESWIPTVFIVLYSVFLLGVLIFLIVSALCPK